MRREDRKAAIFEGTTHHLASCDFEENAAFLLAFMDVDLAATSSFHGHGDCSAPGLDNGLLLHLLVIGNLVLIITETDLEGQRSPSKLGNVLRHCQ